MGGDLGFKLGVARFLAKEGQNATEGFPDSSHYFSAFHRHRQHASHHPGEPVPIGCVLGQLLAAALVIE